MEKIKQVKIEYPDGSLSDEIPFSVNGEYVELSNGQTVEEVIDDIGDDLNILNSAQTALSNKIDSANAKIKANSDEIEVQTARIDNLSHMAEGSTTADAELFDIRVGADGVTYTSAGNSVRTQIDNINSNINKKIYYFNSVADMKAATNLKNGDCVQTLGYYAANDGGNGLYKIRTKVNGDVEDNGYIHFIQNNLVAELVLKNTIINVKQFGAKGDGISDDSNYFKQRGEYFLPNGIYLLDRETYRKFVTPKYNLGISGPGKIKFLNYNDANNTGLVPTNRVYDEVYQSMNAPGDGISYMTSRINGTLNPTNFPMKSDINNLLPIAAIYKNINKSLPDKVMLYIGKIKLMGYSKSQQCWKILSENLRPSAIVRYKLPWTGGTVTRQLNLIIDERTDAYKVELTKEDFYPDASVGADSWVIHYWGTKYYLDQENEEYKDLTQIISCHEAWVETENGEDITDAFLATSSIDSRTSSGTVRQLNVGNYYGLCGIPKKIWSHTIPNSEYEKIADSKYIEELFDRDVYEAQSVIKNGRISLPSQSHSGDSSRRHALLGTLPISSGLNYMWLGDFKTTVSAAVSTYINDIKIKISRANGGEPTVRFYRYGKEDYKLEDIFLVEKDDENGLFKIYINNIASFMQCYVYFSQELYTNTSYTMTLNENLSRFTYSGYRNDSSDESLEIWKKDSFTNTIYKCDSGKIEPTI